METLNLEEQYPLPSGNVTVQPFITRHGVRIPVSERDAFRIFDNEVEARERIMDNPNDRQLFELHREINLQANLVVNSGRQVMANAMTGRDFDSGASVQPWTINKVSWGTFNAVPRFTDTTLSPQPDETFDGGENEIIINPNQGNYKKIVENIDYPQDFVVRFECVLEENEANGNTLREMGLWTQNETLYARKSILPINKAESFGLSFLWRVRV